MLHGSCKKCDVRNPYNGIIHREQSFKPQEVSEVSKENRMQCRRVHNPTNYRFDRVRGRAGRGGGRRDMRYEYVRGRGVHGGRYRERRWSAGPSKREEKYTLMSMITKDMTRKM